MIYQAIETRFAGPTNTRGSRVIAKSQAGRLVRSWDYGLGIEGNHEAAANALAAKLNWTDESYGRLQGGGSADGKGFVWVFVGR
jgi:hypothetical protein